jgi:pimeloyl-ACP methyl ester carboxylesterase
MTDALALIDVADGALAVRDTGSGHPVVLLHGGGLDHRMWEPQIAGLARTHRVLAPDARGHGRSSTPFTPFRHCDDLAELLTRLDLGPATLVGTSMGAATAVDTALEHPPLVHAVVVSGAGTGEPAFHDPWARDVLATWARTQQAWDAAGFVEAFLLFVAGPHRRLDEVDPAVVAACRTMVTETVERHQRPDPATGRPAAALPVPVTRTWERLPGLTVPFLAIGGALDAPDHLAMARRAAELVPGGEAVTVPGAAHYPNLERPGEFDAALRRFLARTDPALS